MVKIHGPLGYVPSTLPHKLLSAGGIVFFYPGETVFFFQFFYSTVFSIFFFDLQLVVLDVQVTNQRLSLKHLTDSFASPHPHILHYTPFHRIIFFKAQYPPPSLTSIIYSHKNTNPFSSTNSGLLS